MNIQNRIVLLGALAGACLNGSVRRVPDNFRPKESASQLLLKTHPLADSFCLSKLEIMDAGPVIPKVNTIEFMDDAPVIKMIQRRN